jgi:hypothetical protein
MNAMTPMFVIYRDQIMKALQHMSYFMYNVEMKKKSNNRINYILQSFLNYE